METSSSSNMCRICLEANRSMKLIFSDSSEFYHQITKIASVQISPDDQLPQEICENCITDLKFSFDFIIKVEKADFKLREKLQNEIIKKNDLKDYNSDNDIIDDDFKKRSKKDIKNAAKHFQSRRKINPEIQRALKDLQASAPSNKKSTECHLCKKNFSCRGQLTRHLKTHVGIRNYTCNICGKSYMESGTLRKHYLFKHMDAEKPHKCDTCERSFEMRSALVRHVRTHTGERPYICIVCQKTFISISDLKKHNQIHSERKRSFVCEVCSKGFTSNQNLKGHLLRHYGEKKFICANCDKAFLTKCTLKSHIVFVHLNERNFMCQICAKVYKSKDGLNTHFLKHTGEKKEPNRQCPMCEKKLLSAGDLNYHIKSVHTHERNYSCEFCSKSFYKAQTLKIHIRYHTGERPYTCNYCEKSFHTGETRKVHERTHNGERPYVCYLCGSSFTQSGSLKTHMKSHC